jgi:hypothetical protein
MTLPVHYTGSYFTRQPDAGIPGSPSVFDSLANPPASGVAAEAVNLAVATDVGVVDSDARALADQTRQRDHVRDFYDSASILTVSE